MIQIDNLVFNAWGRRFFDRASVTLPLNAKVGLVGRNGVGKSTLFKLILGTLQADSGEIAVPAAARVAAVDQEHAATPVTLLDTILAADVERDRLYGELETAEPERMGDIYARLGEIDADRAPARAAEILSGLGFSTEDLARPMAEFSGGWRMRVALASALFAQPDLLLLDEPTNYLDLEGALWLEARLQKYPHSALIISHDRELLNNSVQHILHVSEGKLELYAGGYDDFERRRAEKLRLQSASRAKQEAERAHLQSFVDRFRAKASKAAQAQSRMKRLAKLEPVGETIEERVAPFLLPSPARPLAPPLMRLEGVDVGYGEDPPVLRGLNLRLDIDDRIGLLGVNGAGKSTFAKMAAGALAIRSGRMQREGRIKVGWFHQHQIEALDPDDTPLDIVRRSLPELSDSGRRARLAQWGLGFSKQETTIFDLSGGERARLLLNLVAQAAPHLLILDEPTNHLDIDSRRALLDALNDYEGAVILITHDRSLMELVADRLWLAADGTVAPFEGDMDAYARFVLDRAKGAAPAPTQLAREGKKKGRAMAKGFLMGVLLAALSGGLMAMPARAAQFKTVELPDGGGTGILMTGLIETGDDLTFHNLANTLTNATVLTTGPGGRVGVALNIGNETRARGWTTLVPAGETCASACSMIWLAGERRMLARDAQIGFHAMSTVQDGRLQETHSGDEYLRRWLTDLGYALDATATIVNTHAVSVRWFDAIELRANGIPTEDYP